MSERDLMTADEVMKVLEGPPRSLLGLGQTAADRLSRRYLNDFIKVTDRHIHDDHLAHESPARVTVLNACIDEAAAAIYLSARCFYPQALAHIRSLIEHRDLARLFRQAPQWATLWVDHENPRRWRELRPAAVRDKLGIPKHDPVYALLSEQGAHPTVKVALENIKGMSLQESIHDSRPRITRLFELQFAGVFNVNAGVRCAYLLVYVIGDLSLEAQSGCAYCGSEKTRRRYQKEHAKQLDWLRSEHLEPLINPSALDAETVALRQAIESAAKSYLSSSGQERKPG